MLDYGCFQGALSDELANSRFNSIQTAKNLDWTLYTRCFPACN